MSMFERAKRQVGRLMNEAKAGKAPAMSSIWGSDARGNQRFVGIDSYDEETRTYTATIVHQDHPARFVEGDAETVFVECSNALW